MRDLVQDVRLGLRTLAKAPIVSVLAVLSLGLAISGNTTVFSLVDALLLRPLPFRDPDTLVMLWEANPSNPLIDFNRTSSENFLDFQEGTSVFEHLSAILPSAPGLTEGDRPEPLIGMAVTQGFFEIFGAPPALGRTLQPSDYQQGSERVVVLSHGFWQKRFASDPSLVGKTIQLDGEPHLVAGIMAEGFETFEPRLDLWKPLVLRRGDMPRDLKVLVVLGRLRPDVPIENARQELTVIATRLARDYPDANRELGIRLLTMREQLSQGGNRELMVLLQGALFVVLLIASANIANLYLARGVDRQKEFAVRTAMGASRGRVLRQLLLESFVLAFAAGALGTLLSYWGIRILSSAFAAQMGAALAPRADARVFAFSIVVSVVAGLVFGLAPALSTARADLTGTLHEGGRAGASGGRRLLTKIIVVVEVAAALWMLAVAGILVRTFAAAQNLDSGITMSNVLVFSLDLPEDRYADEVRRSAFAEEVRRELSALPGVSAAAIADHLPRSPLPPSTTFQMEGQSDPEQRSTATLVAAGPGYFDVFRIPLFQGRAFEAADRQDAPGVAIVNEAMARSHFSGTSPLGERLLLQGTSREIVGVVANVREDVFLFDAELTQPIVYVPLAQSPPRQMAVALRSEGDPLSLSGPARETLYKVDPKLSVAEVQSMEDFVGQFFMGMRIMNSILSGFGGLALLLAAIGIYGVIAFTVSRRTHEIGLRMALGARKLDVLKLVVREGLVLVAIGFGFGIPLILLANRLISAALSGVSPFAVPTAVAVGAGLFVVSLFACYVPARRAASLHPSMALRSE